MVRKTSSCTYIVVALNCLHVLYYLSIAGCIEYQLFYIFWQVSYSVANNNFFIFSLSVTIMIGMSSAVRKREFHVFHILINSLMNYPREEIVAVIGLKLMKEEL